MKNMLTFKFGQDLPKLESKKYSLKSVKCLTGKIGDFRLNITWFTGNEKNDITINLSNIGMRELPPLDLTGAEEIELKVIQNNDNIEYDFFINYDIK